MSKEQESLREHVLEVLRGGHAHAPFDQVMADFPDKLRGEKPSGLAHSAWMLLEHMRIAQWDILDYSRNPKYRALAWPDEYWPHQSSPPTTDAWEKSIQSFTEDLAAMKQLVKDPQTDLLARIPWGEGQTILREALLVANHNSHHLGQLIDVRRLLGIWKVR
ncbi:MAG: DinB family protein [Acidobacteria bacterium]|nr:DinB family protein [Acidobacteriota bacterium]